LEAQRGPILIQREVAVLKDNIVMELPAPPDRFGHSISIYSAVLHLLKRPLDMFQIGLPSTWIIPREPASAARRSLPEAVELEVCRQLRVRFLYTRYLFVFSPALSRR
jgi:hypothetical protein